MDDRADLTAADLLNSASGELVRILRSHGEPHAERIARAIVAERDRAPFDLGPAGGGHFLALPAAGAARWRIAPGRAHLPGVADQVNGELDALAGLLPAARSTGCAAVAALRATDHSLEDRMVKQQFAATTQDAAPERLPVVPEGLLAGVRGARQGAEKPNDRSRETPARRPPRLRRPSSSSGQVPGSEEHR